MLDVQIHLPLVNPVIFPKTDDFAKDEKTRDHRLAAEAKKSRKGQEMPRAKCKAFS